MSIHDFSTGLRRARADHNEERGSEYVRRFADIGVHVEAGLDYGSAHLVIRFDDAERLLAGHPGGGSPGKSRSGINAGETSITYESRPPSAPFGRRGPPKPSETDE